MTRAAAGLLVAAVSIGSLLAGATAAADTPCAWTQHSKRLTKKVKRHGKVRRVKRVRRWWTCDPSGPTAPAAAAPTTPTTPPQPPAEGEPEPGLERLGVKADDRDTPWTMTPSRPEIPAGEVMIELQNFGEDPHDLHLLAEGADAGDAEHIAVTGPGEQKAKLFTLAAGSYRLWCDLPEHDEKGMHTTLVVGD